MGVEALLPRDAKAAAGGRPGLEQRRATPHFQADAAVVVGAVRDARDRDLDGVSRPLENCREAIERLRAPGSGSTDAAEERDVRVEARRLEAVR